MFSFAARVATSVRLFSTSPVAQYPKLKSHSGAKKRWRSMASGVFKRVRCKSFCMKSLLISAHAGTSGPRTLECEQVSFPQKPAGPNCLLAWSTDTNAQEAAALRFGMTWDMTELLHSSRSSFFTYVYKCCCCFKTLMLFKVALRYIFIRCNAPCARWWFNTISYRAHQFYSLLSFLPADSSVRVGTTLPVNVWILSVTSPVEFVDALSGVSMCFSRGVLRLLYCRDACDY